jgi:hypothetical protein
VSSIGIGALWAQAAPALARPATPAAATAANLIIPPIMSRLSLAKVVAIKY